MVEGVIEQRKDSIEQRNKRGDRRGTHPNSAKNLIPFKKGQSGNPLGQSITARIAQKFDDKCPFDPLGRSWREALAEGGMRQALTIPAALSNLQDRQEGKVPDKVDVDLTAGLEALLSRLQGRKELPEGEE